MFCRSLLLLPLAFSLTIGQGYAQGANAADGQLAALNGTHLWYKVAGHKTPGTAPLLFLHGGPGLNSYSFEHTIGSKLEEHLQLIYFDQRGAGRSERPPSQDYTMPTLVEDIESLRKALKVPRLSLMGHSFGGAIALEYASRYPAHVASLIIVDGAVDMPDAFEHWQALLEAQYPQLWRTELAGSSGDAFRAADASGNACSIAKERAHLVLGTISKLGSPDFRNSQQFHSKAVQQEQQALDIASGLHNTGEFMRAYFSPGSNFFCYRFTAFNTITMPVLVIGGRFDGSVNFDQMTALAHHLHDAKIVGFDNSAHYPYAEEPEKFDHEVIEFLKQQRVLTQNQQH